ncbi:hypothetical protein NP233_g12486 [Leucocoprinus birnbaumii]|uniref:Uncharacterized protein n=1 Tax=Leucocoprinus birnbaumii TaxID=56174 RepID=A0AAD5VGX4_9AGAR|nr:hypothetical protein NP233_g12486 [Leucocoprinus birnbaumii]
MHNNAHGLGGKHLWPLLLQYLKACGKQVLELVDDRVKEVPRWSNFHHFDAVTGVSFTDASKLEDIVKISLFCTYDLVLASQEPGALLLLRLLRKYLNVDAYMSLSVHTEEAIEAGKKELSEYNTILQEYISASQKLPKPKNWDFPKNHWWSHVFEDIMEKGVTKNSTTQPSEQMHGAIKDAYHLRTNFKNIEPQILRGLAWHRVAQLMEDTFPASLKGSDPDADLFSQSSSKTSPVFHQIQLGARRLTHLLGELIEEKRGDSSFNNFFDKLARFIQAEFSEVIYHSEKITEWAFVRVSYESTVDWRLETDLLRCSAKFHNHPRHDCVMYQAEDGWRYGQLQFVFTLSVSGEAVPLCLIAPLEAVPQSKEDKDLEFLAIMAPKKSLKALPPPSDTSSAPESGESDSETDLAGALRNVDFSWKPPVIPPPSGATHRDYKKVIESATDQVLHLTAALKLLLAENEELRTDAPKSPKSQAPRYSDSNELQARSKDRSFPLEFQKYCENIRLNAKKFGFMYELFVDPAVLPLEFVHKDDRISPHHAERYKSAEKGSQAIVSELYECFPSVLYSPMTSFPAEFAAVASLSKFLIKKIKDTAHRIFPELNELRSVPMADRIKHPAFRALLYGPGDLRVKYPPIIFRYRNPEQLSLIFMGSEIPKVARTILWAQSSLEATRTAPSPPSNGKLWKVKEISPGAIAFSAVVVIYLFSGDTQFRAVGPNSGIRYEELFTRFKEILVGRMRKKQLGIFKWFNKRVFKGISGSSSSNETEYISDVDDAIDAGDPGEEAYTDSEGGQSGAEEILPEEPTQHPRNAQNRSTPAPSSSGASSPEPKEYPGGVAGPHLPQAPEATCNPARSVEFSLDSCPADAVEDNSETEKSESDRSLAGSSGKSSSEISPPPAAVVKPAKKTQRRKKAAATPTDDGSSDSDTPLAQSIAAKKGKGTKGKKVTPLKKGKPRAAEVPAEEPPKKAQSTRNTRRGKKQG